jgi:large subunit ribosomal protein L30
MSSTRYFSVRLKHSGAGKLTTHRKVLEGLGLKRMGKTVVLKDTPAVRGMLYKVVHLVELEPFDGTPPPSARARRQRQLAHKA